MDSLTFWTMAGVVVPLAGEIGRRLVYKPIRRAVDGMKEMHGTVQTMAKEFKENSGASMFDKVKTLVDDVAEVKSQQSVNGHRIEAIDERTADTNETVKRQVGRTDQIFDLMERPLFESDTEGNITRANQAFVSTLGVPNAQILGLGWVSTIAMAERDQVMRELTNAARFKRMYRVPVTFELDKRRVRAVLVAQPVVDGGDVLAYQGALEVLSVTEAAA